MTEFSDSERLAWIAGLLEGEGWFGLKQGRPTVQVTSTDEDVIERLHGWTGAGTVDGPRWRPGHKPVWSWRVSAREDAGWLMELVLPWLLGRRADTVRGILEAWRALPPRRGTAAACGYGHLLAGRNLDLRDGRRRCRKCCARRQREYRERKAKQGV